MSDKIRIKIKKCPNERYWYRKYVGMEFFAGKKTVEYAGKPAFVIDISGMEKPRITTGFVFCDCAEIVEEKKEAEPNKKTNKPIKEK